MTTLSAIAREHGVTPQAVAKWRAQAVEKYGELPFEQVGKSKQYAPEVVDKILEFAPKHRPNQSTAVDPVTEVQICDSATDRTTLTPPELPTSVDLSHLRSGTVESFDNPLELINGARQLIHARRQAMNLDLQNQIARYHQTEAAAVALDDEVRALELEQNRYQIESNLLGILQNQRTAELSKSMGKLNGNGSQSEAS